MSGVLQVEINFFTKAKWADENKGQTINETCSRKKLSENLMLSTSIRKVDCTQGNSEILFKSINWFEFWLHNLKTLYLQLSIVLNFSWAAKRKCNLKRT